MKQQYYAVNVIAPDGECLKKTYPAKGETNAWYIAMELNPGCQAKVLGLVSELDLEQD
jgi:hypothetical protein